MRKEMITMFLLEMWNQICYIITDTIETWEIIVYILTAALSAWIS